MSVVTDFWARLEARDWDAFGATVTTDVVATWPQSRERAVGRAALIRFMAGYPGDWHLVVEAAHVDERGGASRVAFTVDGETVPGLTFFTFDDAGLIDGFTEFWPEPYEPPADRADLLERY